MPADLARQMQQLSNAQLVEPQTPDEYAFRHALTREAVYATILVRDRRRYHQAIAEALVLVHAPALDAQTPALAYHYYEAGDWAKALDYAQRAGAKAQAMFALHEAIQHYTRAIEAAAQLHQPIPIALQRARGQAYDTSGDFEHARLDYEAAYNAARATRDQRAEWQALFDLGFLWASRDYARTGEYLQQALALARAMGDPAILAQSLNRVGNWYANIEQPAIGYSHHQEALAIFESLHDRPGIAETLDLLGLAATFVGDLISGAEYFRRAVEAFRELDNRIGLASALSNLAESGVAHYVQLMVAPEVANAEAYAYITEAHAIARAVGWRPGEAYALINRGALLGSAGNYDEGIASAKAGLALAREIEHEQWQTFACLMLGMLYIDLMALAEAREYIEPGLTLARKIGSLNFERSIAGEYGLLVAQLGTARERARVAQMLDSAMRDDDEQSTLQTGGVPLTMGQRLCWLARGALAIGEKKPRLAMHIADCIIAAPPGAAIATERPPISAVLLRAEALWRCTGRSADAERASDDELASAVAQLQRSLAQLMAQESPHLRWRLHLALGRLYRMQRRHADAQREFAAARAIVTALSEHIGVAALRDNFLARALTMIPAEKTTLTKTPRKTKATKKRLE